MAQSPCADQGGNQMEEATLLKAENAALEMYRFAALLLGDERDVDDIIAAARKVADNAGELRAAKLDRAG